MKSRCDDTHILYVRLNSEQARLLDMLEECREVHVTGRAGTGKTILALEKGRIDSSKNRRTILLCYNNELAQRLAESSDDPAMEISSIHSYALAYLNRYHPNRVLGFSDSPDFDYLMNEFVEVAYDPHEEWDTILIDEGQDFKESWITSIHRLLTDHGNFYIFYDPHQYLYAPVTEFEDKYLRVGIPITLKRNMRNTDQISQACMNILNKPVEEGSLSGVTGICPEILVFDKESIPNALETVLYKLRYSERIDDERISVITLKTENTSIIPRRVQESIPEFKTVRKFKGLENDIVLIVDVELKHLIDPTQQRLLYVALSRARVHSIIFIKIDARYKQYLLRKWNVTNDNLASKIRDYIIGGNL